MAAVADVGRRKHVADRLVVLHVLQQALVVLVGEVVAPDLLETRGLALAGELAALPPMAASAIKQAVQRGLESAMETEWQANLAQQALLLGSEDFGEGLAAVTQKRAASFAGR